MNCWQQCISLPEYNIGDEICMDHNSMLECINASGQLWDGKMHGDYFPSCMNAMHYVITESPLFQQT